MSRRPIELIDDERRSLGPSAALAVAIAVITWLAIGIVFWLGNAGISAAGGVGTGVAGLGVWVLLWLLLWTLGTVAVGGGLVAGFRAWAALYPARRPASSVQTGADELAEARRAAIAEAEELVRGGRH